MPTPLRDDVIRLAHHAEAVLDLSHPLSREYFYASLPLCVIDAVFSIGVRYEGVRNVVGRYCAVAGVPRYCADRATLPTRAEQESIASFRARLAGWGSSDSIAARLGNRQRTSTHATSSILKTEAVGRFAHELQLHGVDYLQDMGSLSSEQ